VGSSQASERLPERLYVSAVVTLEEVEGMYSITTSELDVVGRVADIDDAAFERAVRKAEQTCPVSRALAGTVEILSRSRLEAGSRSQEAA
jgi:osmotically inducible protein OsmC